MTRLRQLTIKLIGDINVYVVVVAAVAKNIR